MPKRKGLLGERFRRILKGGETIHFPLPEKVNVSFLDSADTDKGGIAVQMCGYAAWTTIFFVSCSTWIGVGCSTAFPAMGAIVNSMNHLDSEHPPGDTVASSYASVLKFA